MKLVWWLIIYIWNIIIALDFNPALSTIPLISNASEAKETDKSILPLARSFDRYRGMDIESNTLISYQNNTFPNNANTKPLLNQSNQQTPGYSEGYSYSNERTAEKLSQPIFAQAQSYYQNNPKIAQRVGKESPICSKHNTKDKHIESNEEGEDKGAWSNMNLRDRKKPKGNAYIENVKQDEKDKKEELISFDELPNNKQNLSYQILPLASQDLEQDIRRFVAYAGSSYCPDENIRLWDCGYCKILSQTKLHTIFHDYLTNTHAILYIDEAKQNLVLSYRGAEGFMKLLYVAGETLIDFLYLPGSKVNANYLRSVQAIQVKVKREFYRLLAQPKYARFNIVVVGHSLGGALALLSAPILHFDLGFPQSRIKVYSYGMPRVGDRMFAQQYHHLAIQVIRVVNNRDGITQHPNHAEYHHVPSEVWINQNQFYLCSSDLEEDTRCSFGTPVLSGFFEYHFKVDDLLVTELGC